MKNSDKLKLIQGRKYRVKVRDQKNKVTRIYKWTERREPFGIDCYVFTSKIHPSVTCKVAANGEEISFSGKQLPTSELSVPIYDLVSAELVAQTI